MSVDSNPFQDPFVPATPSDFTEFTLAVGRDASLTLGTDSLIVLGQLNMGIPLVNVCD